MRALLAAWSLVLLTAACTAPEKAKKRDAGACDAGTSRVAVINELWFGRVESPGVGPGFDLDGRVSDASDFEGCKKPDLTSPEGIEGVDSAFAPLVPVLEATQAAAVEGLIHDSIRNGELLLAMELTGIDDPQNDGCIGARMVRADGTPLIGTDDNLLDAQTFERHPEIPPGETETAWIEDGVFYGEGLEFRLELQVLDEFLEFDVGRGKVRGVLHEDGTMTGAFAGAIPVEQILYEFDIGDIGSVRDLIQDVVPAAADLYNPETGECDALSITLEYEAVPGYLFDE